MEVVVYGIVGMIAVGLFVGDYFVPLRPWEGEPPRRARLRGWMAVIWGSGVAAVLVIEWFNPTPVVRALYLGVWMTAWFVNIALRSRARRAAKQIRVGGGAAQEYHP